MKLLKRSSIVAVALAGVLAGGAIPANAIVGGRDATQTYPGMAAMSIVFPGLGTATCGASLVHPRFVLTAAHCVSDQDAAPAPVAMPGGNITVRVGSNDRTAGGVVATGRRVVLHPDWMWGANFPAAPVSDLALVELTSEVRMALTRIGGQQVGEGDPVRLIGWGLTVFPPPPGATLPTTLQERDTTRLPAATCEGGFIGAAEVCLGGAACFGDSGSPALRRTAGDRPVTPASWASVGIASRGAGDGCGDAVYTDPTDGPFRTWIWTTIFTRTMVAPCRSCPSLLAADAASTARVSQLKLKNIR